MTRTGHRRSYEVTKDGWIRVYPAVDDGGGKRLLKGLLDTLKRLFKAR